MACFSAEYRLNWPKGASVENCQIGDDMWVIQKSIGSQIEVHKLDANARKMEKIEFQNGHLIEKNPSAESIYAYQISSSNNKLHMMMSSLGASQLLELDVITMEWKKLMDIEGYSSWPHFLIHDDRMYSGSRYMTTHRIDTSLRKLTELPLKENENHTTNLCEMNGLIYFIHVTMTGERAVHQYDKKNDEFFQLMEDTVGCPIYKEASPAASRSFAWGLKGKIYQVLSFGPGKPLRVDCFDLPDKAWSKLFEIDYTPFTINSASGNDKKVYLRCRNDDEVFFREIDLNPSSNVISLVQTAEKALEDDLDKIRSDLPNELRQEFDDLVNWKLRDLKEMKKLQETERAK